MCGLSPPCPALCLRRYFVTDESIQLFRCRSHVVVPPLPAVQVCDGESYASVDRRAESASHVVATSSAVGTVVLVAEGSTLEALAFNAQVMVVSMGRVGHWSASRSHRVQGRVFSPRKCEPHAVTLPLRNCRVPAAGASVSGFTNDSTTYGVPGKGRCPDRAAV